MFLLTEADDTFKVPKMGADDGNEEDVPPEEGAADDENKDNESEGEDSETKDDEQEGDEEADDGNTDNEDSDDIDDDNNMSDKNSKINVKLKLFDALVASRQQARVLVDSCNNVKPAIADKDLVKIVDNAIKILGDVDTQCSLVISNFTDYDYDKVQRIYDTIKERVISVTSLIKHVIDSDKSE